MKMESLWVVLLGLGGATLSVRLFTQGFELALAAALVEWSAPSIEARSRRMKSMW